MDKKVTRVALVANTAWSIYNFRIGTIREFLSRGIEVSAIGPMDDFAHKLMAEGVHFIPLKMDAHKVSLRADARTLRQLIQIFRKHRFDMVYLYTIKANLYGSLAAAVARIPSISIITGLGKTFQFEKSTQRVVNLVYRFALSYSKQVWFLNESDREQFLNQKFLSESQALLIPSEGVDVDFYKSTDQYVSVSQTSSMRFLYAGRLLQTKGILEYVELAKALLPLYPSLQFDVLGFVYPDNPQSVSLDQLRLWQGKGYISYLGSQDDIRPYLEQTDCVVYPSYYKEGISRILLEAASMSRPIITTDHPGCREVVIHGQSGLLVKPKCVTSLILAAEYMMDLTKDDRIQMGNTGRRYVCDHFDEKLIIDQYLKSLQLIKNKVFV